jgi:lysine/ornithine N-monooxygenase
VTKIERSQSGGHTIHLLSSGEKSEWNCEAVAICSGLHVTPNIPAISGLEKVPIVIHSSEFKERKQFGEGKDILILGSGETGMDIAYLAVTSDTKSVTISHRDGFLCAPKVGNLCLESFKVRIIDLTRIACSRAVFIWHDSHFGSQRKCTVRCWSGESLRYCLRSSSSERFLPPMVVL